jgi:hypothetical protein
MERTEDVGQRVVLFLSSLRQQMRKAAFGNWSFSLNSRNAALNGHSLRSARKAALGLMRLWAECRLSLPQQADCQKIPFSAIS